MLSVLVPVYNEGEEISKCLDSIRKYVKGDFEILVLYDFDEDNTLPAVKKYLSQNDSSLRIRLVKNKILRGASGAIRSGFLEAQGDQVLVTMADLSDDHSQIEMMRDYLSQGYDLVCPSRYCEGGKQELHSLKSFIPRLAGRLLHYVGGFQTMDSTNSYRLYAKKTLDLFPLVSTHSFSVTLEITAKSHCLGLRIKEIPTVWNVRQVGESKFPFLASWFSYFPWFCLAMTNNRFFSLPLSFRKKLCGVKI